MKTLRTGKELKEKTVIDEEGKKNSNKYKKDKNQKELIKEKSYEKKAITEETEIITELLKDNNKKNKEKNEIFKQKSKDAVEEEKQKINRIKEKFLIKRHSHEKELNMEEEINKFIPYSDTTVKCVPLQIPQQSTEIVPEVNIALMSENFTNMISQSIVKIIPRQAVTHTITQGEEKEKYVEHHKPTSANATISFDTNEPYIVNQPETEELTKDLKCTKKLQSQTAMSSLIPSQSIAINENQFLQNVMCIGENSVETNKALLSVSPLEAHSVTEIETNTKEGLIPTQVSPVSKKAKEDFVLKESITVVETTENSTERKFNELLKPYPSYVNVDVTSIESFEINEVFSEIKPEKYYPELIVPTEVAEKSIIPQGQAATSNILQTQDSEQSFTVDKYPVEQTGQLIISTDESLLITETNINEKELEFESNKIPYMGYSSQNYLTQNSIQIKTVQCQQDETVFKPSQIESFVADVNLRVQESIITSEVNFGETEKSALLKQPSMKNTFVNVMCLETPAISETIVHETENILEAKQKPTQVFPLKSVIVGDHIIVTETNLNEFPSHFSETLKYPLEDASTAFSVLEAKEILETVVQENEKQILIETLPSAHATDDSIPQQEISVFQTTVAEKEDYFQLRELPQFHKSKESNKIPLHSLIIEEVTPENIATNFEKFKIPKAQAKIDQDILNEITIEETVQDENVNQYNLPLPTGKTADLSILPNEGINIIEILTIDREKDNVKIEKTEKLHAEYKIIAQKEIINTEVKAECTTIPFTEQIPSEKIAIFSQDTQSSLQITDIIPSEKEIELSKMVIPDKKIVLLDLADYNTSINMLEVFSDDKESDIKETPINTENAKFSLIEQKVAIKSEILPNENILNMQIERPKSIKALPNSEILEEIIVTETTVSETEKNLSSNKKPSEEKANVEIKKTNEISIIEIISQDKEDAFESSSLPKDKFANISLSGQEIAGKEEFILGIEPEDFKPESFIENHAHVTQDFYPSLIFTESVVSESETYFEGKSKPEEKAASLNLEQLTNTLNVTMLTSIEQEISTNEIYAPDMKEAKTEVMSSTSAIISEIISNVNTKNLELEIPSIAKAIPDNETLESAIFTEVTLGEKESIFIKEKLPESKTAETEIIEEQSVIVSINIAQDKEENLLSSAEVIEKKAEFDIIGSTVAESSIVTAENCIEKLEALIPEENKAKVVHLPFQTSVYSEVLTCETEGNYSNKIKPNSKHADLNFTKEKSLSVMITNVNDKEDSLKPFKQPENKYAKKDINTNTVATTSEIIPDSMVDNLFEKVDASTTAQVKSQPLEAIVTIFDTTIEKEGKYEEKLMKQSDKAFPIFEEEQSICVSDTIVQETESDFMIEKVKSKTGLLNINGHPIAEQNEIIPNTELGQLPVFIETHSSALSSYIPIENNVAHLEVIPQENEITFISEKLKNITACTSISSDESIQITEITIGDKETEFKTEKIPKMKTVFSDISPSLDAAQVQEIILQENTGDVTQNELNTALAKTSQIPLYTFTVKETITSEKELNLPNFIEPNNKMAEITYEDTNKSLILTEIVTNDTETENINELQRNFSKANTTVALTEAAGTTEVVTVNNTDNLKKSNIPHAQATPEQIPFNYLSIKETLVTEKENQLPARSVPIVMDAAFTFEAEKSMSVTEIIATENVLDLKTEHLIEKKIAECDITGHIIAQKEEFFPNLCISNITEDVTKSELASIKQILQEAILISEITAEEKETLNVENAPVLTNIAQEIITEKRGIDVAQILPSEKESDFGAPLIPNEKTASVKMEGTGKEVVEQNEILADIGIGSIKEFTTTESTVKTRYIPFQTLSQTVITANEKEQLLNEKSKPITSANVICSKMTSVIISEIMSEDKESELLSSNLTVEKTASKNISPMHEITVSHETILNDSIGEIMEIGSSITTISPTEIPLTHIEVQEIKPVESENILPSNIIPVTKNANINYKENSALTISEIITQDMEEDFTEKSKQNQKFADLNIISKQSFDVSEIIPQNNAKTFIQQTFPVAHAVLDNTICESIFSVETTANEKETNLQTDLIQAKSMAVVEFEENKSISILETVSSETENILKTEQLPEMKQALPKVTGHPIVSQKEILPNENTEKFDIATISQEKANAQHMPYDNLISSLTTVVEKEDLFIDKNKPSENFAFSSLPDEQYGINVLNVSAIETENNLKVNEIVNKVASTSFIPQLVSGKEEVICDIKVGNVPNFIPTSTEANEVQLLFESLIQTQSNIHENEIILTTPTKTFSTANANYFEQSGICISEITSADCEGKLLSGVKPKTENARTEFILSKLPCQSEIILENTTDKFENNFPNISNAIPIPLILNSLETNIPDIIETENIASKFILPDKKMALTELERTNEEICIQEITIQEDEKEILDIVQPKSKIPEINMLTHETLLISEINADTNLTSFCHTIPNKKTAISDYVTNVSTFQTENTAMEREEILSTMKEIKNNAEILIKTDKSVNVGEIFPNESLNILNTNFEPQSKCVNVEIISQSAAGIQEILVLSETKKLEDKLKQQTAAAEWKQDVLHEITTSETFTNEKENELQQFNSKTNEINVSLDCGYEVAVTEVLPIEKENYLKNKPKVTGSIAEIKLSDSKSIEIAEIFTHTETENLSDFEMIEVDVKTKEIPHETISVAEIVTNELESNLSLESTADLHASQNILEKHSLLVTSIWPNDKEVMLVVEGTPKEQIANLDISCLDIAQNLEISPNIIPKEFKTQSVIGVTAVLNQAILNSINKDIIDIHEKEEEFKGKTPVKTNNADIKMLVEDSVNVTLIQPAEKESNYIIPKKINECNASAIINDNNNEALMQSEILVHSITTEIDSKFPQNEVANQIEEITHGLLITELLVQEKEDKFISKFKPIPSIADFEITPDKCAKITQEIITQHKEDTLNDIIIPEVKTADITLSDVYKVAQKSDIIAEVELEESTKFMSSTFTANVTHDAFQSVQSFEMIPHDKEIELKICENSEFEVAKTDVDNVISTNIMEIIPAETEGFCKKDNKPLLQNANAKISGQDVTEISEVLVQLNVSELIQPKIINEQAISETINLNSLELHVPDIRESESIFTNKFKPNEMQANIGFKEDQSLNVLEILTVDKEGILSSLKTTNLQTISQDDLLMNEGLVISETISHSDVTDIEISPEILNKAKIEQSILHSIIKSETYVQENELEFKTPTNVQNSKAEVKLDEKSSLLITEISFDDKEQKLITASNAKTDTAQPNFVNKESIEILDIFPSFDLSTLPDEKINLVTASPSIKSSDSLIIKEQIIQEQGAILNENYQPLKSQSSVLIEANKSINISEIFVADKENTLEQSEPILNISPNIKVEGMETAENTEIILAHGINDLQQIPHVTDQVNISHILFQNLIKSVVNPEEKESDFNIISEKNIFKARVQRDLLTSILQTDLQIQETENQLEEKPRFIATAADIGIKKEKSIIITELTPQENEKPLAIKYEVKKKQAQQSITEQESTIVFDIESYVDTAAMEDSMVPISSASLIQNTCAGLIQHELLIHESETNLEETRMLPSSANVNIEEIQTTIIREIQTTDSEKKFSINEERKRKKAQQNIIMQNSVEILDVDSQVDITDINNELPSFLSLVPTQTTVTGIIQTETRVQDSEDQFNVEPIINAVANVNVEEKRSLIITEMVINEKENNLKKHKSLNVSQTTAEDKEKLDEIDSIHQEIAAFNFSKDKAIIKNEILPELDVDTFDTNIKITSVSPTIIKFHKSAITTHDVPLDSEVKFSASITNPQILTTIPIENTNITIIKIESETLDESKY